MSEIDCHGMIKWVGRALRHGWHAVRLNEAIVVIQRARYDRVHTIVLLTSSGRITANVHYYDLA